AQSERQPFELHNTQPTAIARSPIYVPVGGRPWAPGPVPVSFDASPSFDADGEFDTLTYCWTLPGVTEHCSQNVRDPAFTTNIDTSTRKTLIARLHVEDEAGVRSAD